MGIKARLRRWIKEPEFRRHDGRAHPYQTKVVDRYEELLKRHKRELEGPAFAQRVVVPIFQRHRIEHLVDIERKLLIIDKYHEALISVYHNKLTQATALGYAIETLADAGVPSLKTLHDFDEKAPS